MIIENIENKMLIFLKNKQEYKKYILKKNEIERRKLFTFLLIICSNIYINELRFLTVKYFNEVFTELLLDTDVKYRLNK
jgi:hypothetical protein